MRISMVWLALPLGLAACDGTTPFGSNVTNDTVAEFVTPEVDGTIDHNLTEIDSGMYLDSDNDGYSYLVGTFEPSNAFYGRSGVVVNTDLGTPDATGTATMSGRYGVAEVYGIDFDDVPATVYEMDSESGSITLTADFDNDTLTGSSGNLTVNGTLAGATVGGSVTYKGLNGTLQGQIGSSKAVAAFNGASSSSVYAGGLHVEK